MRAELFPTHKLLHDPRRLRLGGRRDGHLPQKGVRLLRRGPRQKGHAAAGSVVDADGFEDEVFVARLVEDGFDGLAVGNGVGFRHAESEFGGAVDEAVFLV